MFFGSLGAKEYKTERVAAKSKHVLGWQNQTQAILANENPLPLVAINMEANVGHSRVFYDEQNTTVHFKWYNSNQTQQGALVDKWQKDIPFANYHVQAKSQRIIATDITNRVRILDKNGQTLFNFPLAEAFPFSTENIVYSKLNAHADLLLTGLSHPNIGAEITVRNLQNETLFNKKFPGWQVRSIGMDKQANYYAISLYKSAPFKFKTLILNNQGEEMYSSSQRTRRYLFNTEGSEVALIDKNRVELIDMDKKALKATYKLEKGSNAIFIAEAFDAENNLLLQTAQVAYSGITHSPWHYIQNRLLILDPAGEKKADLVLNAAPVITPALWLNTQKSKVYIGDSQGYHIISLK